MSLREPALHVVFHEEGARPLRAEDKFAAIRGLLERGLTVEAGAVGKHSAESANTVVLLVGDSRDEVQNAALANGERAHRIDDLSAPQIADLVEGVRSETNSAKHGEWKPWFPVIDYDRCTNCMQCLSFCLFGVYGVDGDKRIQVQNQDNCKTNCPACSRVCPEAAIMFPKYKGGPINGDTVSDSDLNREKMKIDISALLGGDVYDLLRQRSERAKSRFSKERDSDKALTERKKCLTKLAADGDIPAEVLMSLPSPEEIARRAEEAAAKARAALAQ